MLQGLQEKEEYFRHNIDEAIEKVNQEAFKTIGDIEARLAFNVICEFAEKYVAQNK